VRRSSGIVAAVVSGSQWREPCRIFADFPRTLVSTRISCRAKKGVRPQTQNCVFRKLARGRRSRSVPEAA
jgi:hypothetical protein